MQAAQVVHSQSAVAETALPSSMIETLGISGGVAPPPGPPAAPAGAAP